MTQHMYLQETNPRTTPVMSTRREGGQILHPQLYGSLIDSMKFEWYEKNDLEQPFFTGSRALLITGSRALLITNHKS